MMLKGFIGSVIAAVFFFALGWLSTMILGTKDSPESENFSETSYNYIIYKENI